MTARITHFPVGNGDMTLIELENGKTILIDSHIRTSADDPDDPTPDVANKLKARLKKDSLGRRYVDAFLLSHPDRDHCSGLKRHFHLGPPAEYNAKDDKILMRELWSSPIIFRRASKTHTLCEDAEAFNMEAKRRANLFKKIGKAVGDGDRILILGRDENGKTDDLTAILVETDQLITTVNGQYEPTMTARLLGPLPVSDDECEEEALAKNRSSVILRFNIQGDGAWTKFLTGGDAEVAIWERQWERHKHRTEWLEYNLLLVPHHCSWHTLSYDSWSELREKAQVSQNARNALSQALSGAHIVSSSRPVKDDDNDPPCIRAKREYLSILDPVSGEFMCTDEYPNEKNPEPIEFEIKRAGLKLKPISVTASVIVTGNAYGKEPLGHG